MVIHQVMFFEGFICDYLFRFQQFLHFHNVHISRPAL